MEAWEKLQLRFGTIVFSCLVFTLVREEEVIKLRLAGPEVEVGLLCTAKME